MIYSVYGVPVEVVGASLPSGHIKSLAVDLKIKFKYKDHDEAVYEEAAGCFRADKGLPEIYQEALKVNPDLI